MKTTITVDLNSHLGFVLAQEVANATRNEIVSRHLQRLGYARSLRERDTFKELCAFVRSIPPGDRYSDRYQFMALVKYLFKKDREKRGDHARWQDYIRSVAKHDGFTVPADNDDPFWITFVRHEEKAA